MPQWLKDLHQQLNEFDMANPLTTEQRIYIAAGHDTEKIKMIRELMEDTWEAARADVYSGKEISTSIYKFKSFKEFTNKPNKQ